MKILPGSTIGMLGGGQLGRMFTVAARTMGYEVMVLDPDENSPAGKLASDHLCADYQDPTALAALAQSCDAITVEFENIPATALDTLAASRPVRPSARAVAVTQDRISEKSFLRKHNFPTTPFAVVRSKEDLRNGVAEVGIPAILKVSRFGYDGKGQIRLDSVNTIHDAWQALNGEACILEQRVPLDIELSVVLARSVNGEISSYPVTENRHESGILDISLAPARIDAAVSTKVIETAKAIATALDYIGVLAIEFFISKGELLVNEIAPRPHNSGHYTLDACVTNQFEQQVRAVCGLPLGDTRQLIPAVMVNLLGDLWYNGQSPDWGLLLQHPNIKLHLYGKRNARPGRKMGHYTVVAKSIDQALQLAKSSQRVLRSRAQT